MAQWFIRQLKNFAKWAAIFLVVIVGVTLFAAWLGPQIEKEEQLRREQARIEQEELRQKQQEQIDGWKRWLDDLKAKGDARAKEPPAPGWEDGFKIGYMSGMMAARQGAVKPSSAEVDGIARGAATDGNVSENERFAWTKGFTAGWDFGWTKGR
jgi:hypothetical protein